MSRLKELRKQHGLSQTDFANILGIAQSTLSGWETEKFQIDDDNKKKIADYFNVSIDYLMGRSDISQLPGYIGAVSENKKIPIIGSVKCGTNGLAFEYLDGYVSIDESFSGNVVAFRCKGDSMKGVGINDGDIAIVRQQDDVESGELAVVVVNGDEGTLKRVRKFDGGIILEAANPDYPPRVFTGEDLNIIKIMGKVLETRKKF